jgi:hypothetical protein
MIDFRAEHTSNEISANLLPMATAHRRHIAAFPAAWHTGSWPAYGKVAAPWRASSVYLNAGKMRYVLPSDKSWGRTVLESRLVEPEKRLGIH